MSSYTTEWGVALLPALFLFWQTFLIGPGQRVRHARQRVAQRARADWQGTRAWSYALFLLLITATFTASYYLNHPQPEVYPDSPTYFRVAQQILAYGKFTDALRTPGYPLFISLVFLVAGAANIEAVSVAQAVLFLCATLELYILTMLLFKRSWIALIVGLLMGTNTFFLSFVKPLLSEGMGLWLVISLALLVVLFLQRWQQRYLWLLTACSLLLFLTRPEWIYLPVPLFAYLLFVAWRHGRLRRFLPQGLLALALLYGVLGVYMYANGVQNGFIGVTDNQSGNLLGKILQYHMQNEAPPQYAQVASIVNTYVQQGGIDPNALARIYPPLVENHWALAGAYSDAIVLHHPLEFLLKTVPIFFTSSKVYYLYSSVSNQGPFAFPLVWIQERYAYVYDSFVFFPFFALFWVVLFFWRRTARLPVVEGMAAVVLLPLYGLTLTSLGGYVDYTRLHVPFDPLFLLPIVATLLAAIPFFEPYVARWHWRWRTVWLIAGGLVLAAVVLSVVGSLLAGGLKEALDPQTWMVTHLIVKHPLPTLAGLGVVAILVWLAYRAHLTFVRNEQMRKKLAPAVPALSEDSPFLEGEAHEAPANY